MALYCQNCYYFAGKVITIVGALEKLKIRLLFFHVRDYFVYK